MRENGVRYPFFWVSGTLLGARGCGWYFPIQTAQPPSTPRAPNRARGPVYPVHSQKSLQTPLQQTEPSTQSPPFATQQVFCGSLHSSLLPGQQSGVPPHGPPAPEHVVHV